MFREGSGTIFIAMGLVFVLLLGEIDLAAGYTAGICASVMARMMDGYGWNWYLTIPTAIVTGLLIGLLIGVIVAKVRIPSFVVTLSFFLAFQGVCLLILNNGPGQHGQITLSDPVVNGFANSLHAALGGLAARRDRRRRLRRAEAARPGPAPSRGPGRRTGTPSSPSRSARSRWSLGVVVYLLSQNRATGHAIRSVKYVNHKPQYVLVQPPALQGVPYVIPVLLVLFVLLTFVLTRTRYGRHVYAVGGNDRGGPPRRYQRRPGAYLGVRRRLQRWPRSVAS